MPSKAGIRLKNRNAFDKSTREDIREWANAKQVRIARLAAVQAKRNVPPGSAHWKRARGAPPFKARGRLRRAIRYDKRAKRYGRRYIVSVVGVGRRGHVRFSAPAHEFGMVIHAKNANFMRFRVGPRTPFIHKKVVRIREKRYLKHAIGYSLRRLASNVSIATIEN